MRGPSGDTPNTPAGAWPLHPAPAKCEGRTQGTPLTPRQGALPPGPPLVLRWRALPPAGLLDRRGALEFVDGRLELVDGCVFEPLVRQDRLANVRVGITHEAVELGFPLLHLVH